VSARRETERGNASPDPRCGYKSGSEANSGADRHNY
jgi:hypothetical protein